jgi:hypothetical protein
MGIHTRRAIDMGLDTTDLFPDLPEDPKPCQGLWDAKSHVRATDPDTSVDAAEQAESLSTRHMKIILGVLREHPNGLTSQEIESVLFQSQTPLTHAQVWRRMSDLKLSGDIEDSGLRRPTTSNRQAAVWKCRERKT